MKEKEKLVQAQIDYYQNILQRNRNEKISLYKKIAVNEEIDMQLSDFVCSLKTLKQEIEKL